MSVAYHSASLFFMKSRTRVLAALLALLAFSASFAEGVWASMCAPMDSMASMEHSAAVAPSAHSMASDGNGGSSAAELPEKAPAPDPGCPLTLASGGCMVVFSPAPAAGVAVTATVLGQPMAALNVAPDLLLVSALLRPPRA